MRKTEMINLSPLMIYTFPCNTSFEGQQTGPGPYTDVLYITIPIFKENQFHYVPWKSGTDERVLDLHYESLKIPPPLHFDNKTISELNEVYNELDT